jgi:uncharacterized alkaline shock family protein YloU
MTESTDTVTRGQPAPAETPRNDQAAGTLGSEMRPASQTGPRGTAVARASFPMHAHAHLQSDRGNTHIADGVVSKIAGLAAREIPGVQSMGKGLSRTLGAFRQKVTRASDEDLATQGISVEVGERQAAIDIDIVTYYGQSIAEVSQAVRENVIERVEGMTGLEVTEVNISVDDLFVDADGDAGQAAPRVQ